MKVVEKFISINGEGKNAGVPSVFVRFKGCNLSCTYCDTKWANEPDCPYEELSARQIAEYITGTGIKNVTLTGGEPLMHSGMRELLGLLGACADICPEIETNGSVDIAAFPRGERISFTMDYKLPSSGMEDRMLLSNMGALKKQDVVKFVIGSDKDLERAFEITKCHGLVGRCHVHFSPIFGKMPPAKIADFIIRKKINGVRLSLQLHKIIWDPGMRGV